MKEESTTVEIFPESDENERSNFKKKLLFSVDENPSIILTIVLGFQHFLVMSCSTIMTAFLIIDQLCMENNFTMQSEILGLFFFVMGMSTLVQSTFGVRLPIVQGANTVLAIPIMAMFKGSPVAPCGNNETVLHVNKSSAYDPESSTGLRIRYISGVIIIASLIQLLIGLSGVVALIVRFIGPLTIAPILTLISLSLIQAAVDLASYQWWIALCTVFLNIVFTFYLEPVLIPLPAYSRKDKCHFVKVQVFSRCPMLLSVVVMWIVCAILTVAGVFPNDSSAWGYEARTDIRLDALKNASWFKFPYPMQYGTPLVMPSAILSFVSAFIFTLLENMGDYYVFAFVSGAPPPPRFTINRGISVEAFTSFLSGLLGCPCSTTAYCENLGLIMITQVGSRIVMQCAGLIMILVGLFTKAAALFVSIPKPIIGGLYITVFSFLTGIGISNVRHLNLLSSRNIFIVGFSIFFGLAISDWSTKNSSKIDLKYPVLSQTASTALQTSMLIGGLIGFILDNTIPGSKEDRGLISFHPQSQNSGVENDSTELSNRIYRIYEFILCRTKLRHCISNQKWLSRWPICPTRSQIPQPDTSMETANQNCYSENGVHAVIDGNPTCQQINLNTMTTYL